MPEEVVHLQGKDLMDEIDGADSRPGDEDAAESVPIRGINVNKAHQRSLKVNPAEKKVKEVADKSECIDVGKGSRGLHMALDQQRDIKSCGATGYSHLAESCPWPSGNSHTRGRREGKADQPCQTR